ncbi:MAG: hypothetical protein ACTTK5_00480 [Candidatus Fimenecus sp.]
MKSSIFSKNITPSCAYCTHAKIAKDNETFLCLKKGIVSNDYSCKKYSYDIFKRIPKRLNNFQNFSENDFEL